MEQLLARNRNRLHTFNQVAGTMCHWELQSKNPTHCRKEPYLTTVNSNLNKNRFSRGGIRKHHMEPPIWKCRTKRFIVYSCLLISAWERTCFTRIFRIACAQSWPQATKIHAMMEIKWSIASKIWALSFHGWLNNQIQCSSSLPPPIPLQTAYLCQSVPAL